MIKYLQALLPGIAGSVAFWAMDTLLIKAGGNARIIGMIVVFLLLSGASVAVMRARSGSTRRVASGRTVKGDLDDRFGDVRIRRADDVDVLSGNRVGGNSYTSVDKLDIE